MATTTRDSTPGDWDTGARWDNGSPGAFDTAVLNAASGGTNLSAANTCFVLDMDGYAAALDLNGNDLTVNGDTTLDGEIAGQDGDKIKTKDGDVIVTAGMTIAAGLILEMFGDGYAYSKTLTTNGVTIPELFLNESAPPP